MAKLTRFPRYQEAYKTRRIIRSLRVRALRHPAKMEVTGRLFIWAILAVSCGAQLNSTEAEGKKIEPDSSTQTKKTGFYQASPETLKAFVSATALNTENSPLCSLGFIVISLRPIWPWSLK
jgi:hypothetical protein